MFSQLKSRYLADRAFKWAVTLCGVSCILILALIIVFVVREARPAFSDHGFWNIVSSSEWKPDNGSYGIWNMVVGSIYVTSLALIISVPLGIFCALFLTDVAPPAISRIVKPAIEVLVGIPSVVYGLVGVLFLLPYIGDFRTWVEGAALGLSGKCLLAAAIVLSIMVLPTIVSITEDSIRAVPRRYREGSLALGATRWQTLWHVVLPAARSGILAAIVLGMGRAIGETMAVVMVIGNTLDAPVYPWDPGRTLTSTIVLEYDYADPPKIAALFAIGVVLLLFILVINSAAMLLRRRFQQ